MKKPSTINLNTIANAKTNLTDRSINARDFPELFTTVSAQHRLVRRKPQPLAVFPLHFTNTEKYFKFQEAVYNYFINNVGEGVDKDGYILSGKSTNPSPLLTTMPFNSLFSYPPVSNTKAADAMNIATDFESDEHKSIFADLMHLMHKDYVPVSVSINKGASAGPVTYEKDVQVKLQGMVQLAEHFEDVMSFIKAGDLRGLFDKHGFLLYSTVGSRLQQDGGAFKGKDYIGKPRPFYSREYAMTGGTKGKIQFVEKDLFLNKDFINDETSFLKSYQRASARTRLVYGYQTPLVQFINQLVTPMMESNHDRYEETYKTRGYDSLAKSIEGSTSVIGVDVSNHDTLIRWWMLKEYIHGLPVTDDVKLLISLLARAPYMRPPLNEGDDPVFSADPFDIKSYDHESGLPSGVGMHSAFGKLFMTFTYVIMITDFTGYKGIDWLDSLLRGNDEDVKLKDSVDDALYIFKKNNSLQKYLYDLLNGNDITSYKSEFKGTAAAKLRIFDRGQPSPYHTVEAEHGIAYLGSQISRSPITKVTHIGPNILNYVKNFYMPENGIHSKTRTFWFLGFSARKEIFARAINGTKIMADIDNLFALHCGEHPDDIIRHFEMNNKAEIAELLEPKSAVEVEILLDNSKLQYKYLIGHPDLRDEFAEQFITVVPKVLRELIFKVGLTDQIKRIG